MAPEYHLGMGHQSDEADYFALAVSMFALAYGTYPFRSTRPDDERYNFIDLKNWTVFWELNSATELSEEFKDLFWLMVQNDPAARLKEYEHIKKHCWFKGETASDLELGEELNERRRRFKDTLRDEVQDAKPETDQNVFSPTEARKGESPDLPEADRQLKEYEVNGALETEFFSLADPKTVLK